MQPAMTITNDHYFEGAGVEKYILAKNFMRLCKIGKNGPHF